MPAGACRCRPGCASGTHRPRPVSRPHLRLGAHRGLDRRRPGTRIAGAGAMTNTSVRPLHVAKLVPPPYAGVEAHVDTVLRALLPEVEGMLVAGTLPSGATLAPPPYRVLV